MSSLKFSRYRALDGSILLWRERCRKLATNSEIIAQVHNHTAQILCVIVTAERVWDSQICHIAFHNRNDSVRALFARALRPLSTRGAVDEHHNVPRSPERSWVRSSSVDVDTSQQLRYPSRHAIWSGWPIPFRPRTSRTLNQFPYQADPMLFRCHFQYTRIGVGKGNVKVVNVYFLAVFQ